MADGTVWLTQAEISVLFESSKQNVSYHIEKVLAESEQAESATVKYHLTVRTLAKRE